MAGNKIKNFLFPTEEEKVSDMVQNERNFGVSGKINKPEVEVNDNVADFINPVKSSLLDREIKKPAPKGSLAEAGVHAPNSFEDAEKIAKDLISGRTVIVNLENLLRNDTTRKDATRVIDFLCGVSYPLKIEVKKINNTTFIFTPPIIVDKGSLMEEKSYN